MILLFKVWLPKINYFAAREGPSSSSYNNSFLYTEDFFSILRLKPTTLWVSLSISTKRQCFCLNFFRWVKFASISSRPIVFKLTDLESSHFLKPLVFYYSVRCLFGIAFDLGQLVFYQFVFNLLVSQYYRTYFNILLRINKVILLKLFGHSSLSDSIRLFMGFNIYIGPRGDLLYF